MIALKNQTVAEIVLDYPNSVRLFESYKIDYCCKGKLTLEEACYLKNLDSNHVAAMITEIISEKKNLGEDFSQLTIHTLIDIVLHRHHNYVNNSIPIIKDHLGKVLAKHGSDYPFLSEIHDKFADLAIELEQHMVKEEQILFPYLSFIEEVFLKGVADSRISVFLKHPVHMMENDHERAGEVLEQIRSISSNYHPPSSACPSFKIVYHELEAFEKDLHQHVFIENNVLFPKGIAMEKEILLRGSLN